MKNANFAPKGLTEILKVPRTSRATREFTHTFKHPILALFAQGRQGRHRVRIGKEHCLTLSAALAALGLKC